MVDENLIRIIRQYKEVLKDEFNIDRIFLFGSFARGCNDENSDIDVAVFVKDKVSYEDEIKAFRLRRNIDLRIEPHLFSTEELNDFNPFLEEIIKTGIKVA
jgi:predicted nucleotidyltransferase